MVGSLARAPGPLRGRGWVGGLAEAENQADILYVRNEGVWTLPQPAFVLHHASLVDLLPPPSQQNHYRYAQAHGYSAIYVLR